MMMLQAAEAMQVGGTVLSGATLVLVLRLTFRAGQVMEKVESNERRLDHLEKIACPHQECPFKVRAYQDFKVEGEG